MRTIPKSTVSFLEKRRSCRFVCLLHTPDMHTRQSSSKWESHRVSPKWSTLEIPFCTDEGVLEVATGGPNVVFVCHVRSVRIRSWPPSPDPDNRVFFGRETRRRNQNGLCVLVVTTLRSTLVPISSFTLHKHAPRLDFFPFTAKDVCACPVSPFGGKAQ